MYFIKAELDRGGFSTAAKNTAAQALAYISSIGARGFTIVDQFGTEVTADILEIRAAKERIGQSCWVYEIQVNGIPRTYRDRQDRAIDAGQFLKGREETEIKVTDLKTGKWVIIPDPYSAVGEWKAPKVFTVVG